MNNAARLCTWIVTLACCTAAYAQSPPNIIFMLSDDQHWDGLSVPMHPDSDASFNASLSTPNAQRLADQGMRFSSAYAPAPVCAPTRISIVAGMSPAALHWTKAGPTITASRNPPMIPPRNERDIDAELITFAELLQTQGYTTAHFGKWHIDGGGPERHGFDVSDGNIDNEAAARYSDPNPVDLFGMAERAEQFMQQANEAGQPFFIQLSWLALHAPENALATTVQRYQQEGSRRSRQAYSMALTEDMDTAVGRVMAAVDRLGLTGNTYVIFMSDNGANSRDGLAGGKGNLFEGGIRVPLIVRGPGIEAGSWSHTPVVGYDLYPTFLEWAGLAELPQPVAEQIEGGSLAGLLDGSADTVTRSREGLFFHFPHYQTDVGPHSAVRMGEWKLIKFHEDGATQLYHLEDDLLEHNDLAGEHPDIAARLEAAIDRYLAQVDAQMPSVNTGYNPDQPFSPNTQQRRDRGPSR